MERLPCEVTCWVERLMCDGCAAGPCEHTDAHTQSPPPSPIHPGCLITIEQQSGSTNRAIWPTVETPCNRAAAGGSQSCAANRANRDNQASRANRGATTFELIESIRSQSSQSGTARVSRLKFIPGWPDWRLCQIGQIGLCQIGDCKAQSSAIVQLSQSARLTVGRPARRLRSL